MQGYKNDIGNLVSTARTYGKDTSVYIDNNTAVDGNGWAIVNPNKANICVYVNCTNAKNVYIRHPNPADFACIVKVVNAGTSTITLGSPYNNNITLNTKKYAEFTFVGNRYIIDWIN